MPVAAHVSVEEYLQPDDSPARELVAGELIPKPMGTRGHSRMQARLEELLKAYEKQGLGEVYRELTIRRGDGFLIPDLVFVASDARFEDDILVDPPVLCIEVISPSQRPSERFARCEVYHRRQVPYIWVVEPVSKAAWRYHQGSAATSIYTGGSLEAGQLRVPLSSLFE